MSTFESIVPNRVQVVRAYIISGITQQAWDVSSNIPKIVLYENIFSPFISGEVYIADDSNLVNEIPLVGQEVFQLYFQYKDKEIARDFHVAEIENIKNNQDSYGSYVLKIVDHKQMLNAINTFSRSYSGRNTDIIANIHGDFLNSEIEVVSQGASSHNVVFPYGKPYQAITMMLKNTFAADGSPLYLYDSLNGGVVYLKSLTDMYEEDPLIIDNVNNVNYDEDGQAQRQMPDQNTTASTQIIRRAYPTYRNINEGYFASNITTVDIANKTYTDNVYNYNVNYEEEHEYHNKYLSDNYRVDERTLYNIPEAYKLLYYTNARAFPSLSVGNVSNLDSVQRATHRAYHKMLKNQAVLLRTNPRTDIEVGKMLNLHIKRMKPNMDENLDSDPVNSGSYLCSAIKHVIEGSKYTLNVEAVRSGINNEVSV